MSEIKKVVLVVLIIPMPILLYFAENIKGYYRFKQYCENEGGLKVYEKLEKNVGWMTESKNKAKTVSFINNVDFSHYVSRKDGELYDLKYIGGHLGRESSYSSVPANKDNNAVYLFEVKTELVDDELRLEKTSYKIKNIKSNSLMAVFNIFSYSMFDRNKTLLHAPSGEMCNSSNQMIKEFNNIFKD